MIIEKIVFGVLSIALFTIFFLKMIGKNNATYVYLLVVQFIGMLISFLELIFSIKLNAIIKVPWSVNIGWFHFTVVSSWGYVSVILAKRSLIFC